MSDVTNQTGAPTRIANSARSVHVGRVAVVEIAATSGAPIKIVITKVVCMTQP